MQKLHFEFWEKSKMGIHNKHIIIIIIIIITIIMIVIIIITIIAIIVVIYIMITLYSETLSFFPSTIQVLFGLGRYLNMYLLLLLISCPALFLNFFCPESYPILSSIFHSTLCLIFSNAFWPLFWRFLMVLVPIYTDLSYPGVSKHVLSCPILSYSVQNYYILYEPIISCPNLSCSVYTCNLDISPYAIY